jgi:bifunctional polynucleotide phosphatase/kinase
MASITKLRPKLRKQPVVPAPSPAWTHTDSCWHLIRPLPAAICKLAIFDLDGTLMEGDTLIDSVIEYALSVQNQGYRLVVISNQYGITKGQTTHQAVQARFKTLSESLKEVSFLYATEKDHYRKPMTGMFDLLNVRAHPCSFYCGDAVGRAKDFAVSDFYFARNCGLKCIAAPDLSPVIVEKAAKHMLYTNLEPLSNWLIKPSPELGLDLGLGRPECPLFIVMIGPQGSGKSTLANLTANLESIMVLNRDTIGSTAKMKTRFRAAIKDRTSVILDNTNYSRDGRSEYISVAREAGYKILIYYFDIPKELSMHMCHMRVQLGGPRIPPVAIHTYYKRLVAPSEDEGEIIYIRGVLVYDGMPKQYYYHYDLKER